MLTVDTLSRFETPEGIALELSCAGPAVRALAFMLDALIRGALYIALSISIGLLGELGIGVLLIGFFLIEWFYPVFFELRSGSTPGKKAFGLTVVHDNGTPIGWSASLLRNLLRIADMFPIFYGLGLLSSLIDPRFRRLGDIVAGTLVIYREKESSRLLIDETAPKVPPFQMNREEQRALLDLVERKKKLSDERGIELAELLSPLNGRRGKAAMDDVMAYANWLLRGN